MLEEQHPQPSPSPTPTPSPSPSALTLHPHPHPHPLPQPSPFTLALTLTPTRCSRSGTALRTSRRSICVTPSSTSGAARRMEPRARKQQHIHKPLRSCCPGWCCTQRHHSNCRRHRTHSSSCCRRRHFINRRTDCTHSRSRPCCTITRTLTRISKRPHPRLGWLPAPRPQRQPATLTHDEPQSLHHAVHACACACRRYVWRAHPTDTCGCANAPHARTETVS